jgi:magnesium-transporting ATPase (P-type)
VNSGASTTALAQLGGSKIICQKLETTLKSGIQDTPESKARRVAKFGTNELVEPPAKTLWMIFVGCFEDLTLQILCVAAVVSLIIGISTEGLAKGWIEGAAIMVAVIIVVTITTVNDYTQAQQFRNLFKKSQVKIVKVVRDSILKEIDTQDLVVGDVYELNTGLIVPADSLLIEKHGTLSLV